MSPTQGEYRTAFYNIENVVADELYKRGFRVGMPALRLWLNSKHLTTYMDLYDRYGRNSGSLFDSLHKEFVKDSRGE